MGNSQCVFCTIIKDKKNLLYEDDLFVMFGDISPIATVHIQAVPKRHIQNINYLENSDLELIRHIRQKSMEYLVKNYGEDNSYE